jgi:TctA family transporter
VRWGIPLLLLLASCTGLMDVLADPAVQEGLQQTAESAATGNWLGALWGIGATVVAVASHKTYKRVKKVSKQVDKSTPV